MEGSHKRVSFLDGVLERLKSSLGRWKGRFLSLPGRVCLLSRFFLLSHCFIYLFISCLLLC